MDIDETLKELLHDTRMATAVSSDPLLLSIADRVNALHEHMMTGGFPPTAWRSEQELARDQIAHAQHEQLLLMAWILHQQSTPELRIPYMEIETLEGTYVQRYDDHAKQEIVFRLMNPPKPTLTLVENR